MSEPKTDAIVNFMRENYSDERLSWLLAHAEDGKLAYRSCCCFIGIVTADHELATYRPGPWTEEHLKAARWLPHAIDAEYEFSRLGDKFMEVDKQDAARRATIIPLIEAEIARRDALKREETGAEVAQDVELALV